MRIGLVGPTYPFKGGIAHHTTLLCQALRKKHTVAFISFSRNYPRFLFPGKDGLDPSKDRLVVSGVDFLIDWLNPATWLRAGDKLARFCPDVVIFPWWTIFWTLPFLAIQWRIRTRGDAAIAILCHNAVDHEASLWKVAMARKILSSADCIITQSKEESRKVRGMVGSTVKVITAFHPTYSPLCGTSPSKEEAKADLGLEGNVILFFGFVRPYKGLGILLQAMPEVLRKEQVTLLVVGEFWDDKEVYLKQIGESGIGHAVRIVDRYVPNEELGRYFAAADLVVQPYISASGSGICQLAYGFGKPVIATNVGSLGEVIMDRVNGRIVEPNNNHALAQAIVESLRTEKLTALTEEAGDTPERFSWKRMADILTGTMRNDPV